MLKEPQSPHLPWQVEGKLPPIYKVREKVSPEHWPQPWALVDLPGGSKAGTLGQAIVPCKKLHIYYPWTLRVGSVPTPYPGALQQELPPATDNLVRLLHEQEATSFQPTAHQHAPPASPANS